MPDQKPAFPENPTVEQLQDFYKKAVASRYIKSNYDDHAEIVLDLHTELAALGKQVKRIPREDRHKAIDPESDYALQLAELLWEVIRLANSEYGTVDLTAALKAQENKHDEQEAKRAKKAEKDKKKWYDAQPKYHAEDSGKNPLRPDGLYGKAAQAADGDWYSSH